MTLVAVFPVLQAINAHVQSLPESVLACVPCHNTGDSDQVGEWLASPYSAQQAGLGCAGCHHQTCSGNRASATSDHTRPAVAIERLREAARLTVTAVRNGDAVVAEVAVANVGAGHLLPSGSADRILILAVTASDQAGGSLPQRSGPKVPTIAGEVAETAGRIYLEDPRRGRRNGEQPRLAPFATDVSRYRFESPEAGPAQVSARLLLVQSNGAPLEMANTAVLCRPMDGEP